MPAQSLATAIAAAVAVLLLAAAPAVAEPEAAARQALPGPDLRFRTAAATGAAAERRPISRGRLRHQLRRLAGKAPGASSYYVTRIGGRAKSPIFDRNAGHSRKLASNEKLFTTATALDRLGGRWRIPTRVKAGRVGRKGRLRGDIYLIGGGDPSFGAAGIDDLARQVHEAGIRRVGGSVIADAGIFDRRRGVPDSNWGPSPYIAPLSGLVYGGSTYDGDPARAAARKFRSALRDAGVRVGGRVEVGRMPGRLRDRDAVAEHESATIAALVRATNKDSLNFYAEMLLKRLWATAGRKGTTEGGVKAVERFARRIGSRVRARDGSGLTAGNRSSARDVVRLLVATHRDREIGRPLFKSLSIAGKDGTLAHRMDGSAAAGSCRGKTGTLTGVSNLSGYCRANGGLIAFSLLMNGVSDLYAAHAIQDDMVIQIARLR